MKKLMSLLFALALLLSGCAFGDQEPDAATANPLAFPVGTNPYGVIDLLQEWPVKAELSDAKRQEIKKAWSDHEGIDHTGHVDYLKNVICDLVWCGNWNGYELLIDLSKRGQMLEGAVYGKMFFQYACYFYQDGTFHSLENIYAAGILGETEARALEALDAEPSLAYNQEKDVLLDAIEQDIQKALQGQGHRVPVMAYYGAYNGYVVYQEQGPQISFGPEPIVAYRLGNGSAKPLDEVYEAGEISREDYERIWEMVYVISRKTPPKDGQ